MDKEAQRSAYQRELGWPNTSTLIAESIDYKDDLWRCRLADAILDAARWFGEDEASSEGEQGNIEVRQSSTGKFFAIIRHKDPLRTEIKDIGNAAEVRKFCKERKLKVVREIKDASSDKTTTIKFRLAPSLKAHIEKQAAKEEMSVNEWLIWCAEMYIDLDIEAARVAAIQASDDKEEERLRLD